jgi:hypothetical protein
MRKEATWKVVWGGETITAPSAFDVLAIIGERSYSPADAKYPKRGIAYRVWVQYGVIIDPDLTEEEFLIGLAEYGVIRLSVTGKPLPDALTEARDFYESFHQKEIENND